MKKGYWVAVTSVKNQEKYSIYAKLALPAIEQYGGKVLSRGGEITRFEGDDFNRIVLIEFKSKEQAIKCYHSEEYQNAKSNLNSDISFRNVNIIEEV